ncbi:MAG: CheY-P phosphatase CheX [Anaerolineae bacterium]|nr:CheY-P phosphatase CheX [Anaerolineae bacterium]
MRVELLNPFIVAAGEVLNSELDVKATRGQLRLQRDTYVSDDITVLISLVGDVWGVAIISLSFETAKAIVSHMLGETLTEFNELAQSGIGELGNVITGQAATKLAQVGYKCDISVPTMIVGKGSRISTFDIDRLIVPLQTEFGILSLTLALRESQGK